MLSKLMEEHPVDWDKILDHCTFNYNTAKHAFTQFSPYYLNYGREPCMLLDHIIGHVDYPPVTNLTNYTKQLVQRIQDAKTIAQKA